MVLSAIAGVVVLFGLFNTVPSVTMTDHHIKDSVAVAVAVYEGAYRVLFTVCVGLFVVVAVSNPPITAVTTTQVCLQVLSGLIAILQATYFH